MSVLDNAIGLFSPGWKAARLKSRMVIQAYEAVLPTRTHRARRENRSANQLSQFGGRSLREQARWLDCNHDLVIGVLDKLEERIVGAKGIIVEPQPLMMGGQLADALATQIRAKWGEWSVSPDVTGQFTRPVLERLMARTWLRDGEVFAQLVSGTGNGLLPVAEAVLVRVANLLDLRLDPAPMLASLGELATARPGLRLPGCVDPFEQAIRAILGQLVSVALAAKLTGKLAAAFGTTCPGQPGWMLFPEAKALARLSPEEVKTIGIPLMRAQAIVNLAQTCEAGVFPLTRPQDVEQGVKHLISWPGIGRWTANYYALRGWQAPDVFLPDDYAIKQRFAGMTPAAIRRYATCWAPWRSYALLHIWYSSGWQPVS